MARQIHMLLLLAALLAIPLAACNAQDKSSARLDLFEGTVEFIDSRRGQFEIRDKKGRLVIVSLLYNPPRPVVDRFNSLRKGDYVRVEGLFINQDRFELENFL